MSETALRASTDRGDTTTATGKPDSLTASISTAARRPRIVIVGAGFGGLVAARALRRVDRKSVV